jgi:hypothetical protein
MCVSTHPRRDKEPTENFAAKQFCTAYTVLHIRFRLICILCDAQRKLRNAVLPNNGEVHLASSKTETGKALT